MENKDTNPNGFSNPQSQDPHMASPWSNSHHNGAHARNRLLLPKHNNHLSVKQRFCGMQVREKRRSVRMKLIDIMWSGVDCRRGSARERWPGLTCWQDRNVLWLFRLLPQRPCARTVFRTFLDGETSLWRSSHLDHLRAISVPPETSNQEEKIMINSRLGIDSGIRWTDIWFIGCESSTVERGFGSECFYDQQSPSIVNLPRPADLSGSQREIKQGRTHPRGLIFAACDKVRPVWSQLQIRHHIHMCSLVIENLLSGFSIEEGNFSWFVTGDDQVWAEGKGTNDSLGANRIKEGFWLFWFCTKRTKECFTNISNG